MKREMFRKLMAASLATVMVAGLAGCGNDDNSSSGASDSQPGSTGASVENSGDDANSGSADGEVSKYPLMKDANGNVYDLGGAEVSIYTWFGEGLVESPYSDAVREYREWAQKTYNFTMTWDDGGGWGSFNDFADLASGAKDTEGKLRFYMLPAGQPTVMAAMKGNLMWNLSSLGVFDLNEARYKNNGIADLYKMDGDVYCLSAQPPEPRTGMIFNATLLEQVTGITADEIFDLQAKGEWTYDKFEEICELIYKNGDTNSDGVLDVYAVSGNVGTFINACVRCNGGTFAKLNSDGKFEYMVDSPATQEGLEFQRKIRSAPYWYNNPEKDPVKAGEQWDYFYAAFDEQGQFVFLPDQAYQFNDGQRLNVNAEPNSGTYCMVMFPVGPSANGKFINTYEDNIMAIPKCYTEDEARTIAAAYDIWYADVIPGYIGYNARLDGYEVGVHDRRTLDETLTRMMSEGANIDTSGMVPNTSFIQRDDQGDVWETTKTISEVTSEYESRWKKAIDDYNNK